MTPGTLMAARRAVQVAPGDRFRRLGMVEPPRLPPGVLRRERLADQFTFGANHRLTLVSAGPGWGKTMAAASWATSGSTPGPVAWWSLHDADNDPRSFWSNLVSAVVASGAVPAKVAKAPRAGRSAPL